MAKEEQYDQETQNSKLLLDHDYDGIKELDNPPPPWLMIIFYGTIIWAVFYMFYYNVFDGTDQYQEYAKEMADAKASIPVSVFDEANVALLTDEAALAEGNKIFVSKNCDLCHGKNNIGPNLTDKYWIHGNTPTQLFKVIKYGVAEKGMTSFKDQLTDVQIQQVLSYVLVKLKGSPTENTKGPEGNEIN